MTSREKPVAKRIKENQLGILLTILGLIQGLAFSRLIILTFDALRGVDFSWYTFNIGVHAIFCFLIILRLFETIFLGFLDYDEVVISFGMVVFIFVIGAFEYWIIDTFIDFSPDRFYSRVIFLGILTMSGYTVATLNISLKRNRRKVFNDYSSYLRELMLQLVNLLIPLILLVISILVLKGVFIKDITLVFLSVFLSLLITINIVTSWVLTVNGPKVIEPWDYSPVIDLPDNINRIKISPDKIKISDACDEDALGIAELLLASFPYVFRDFFGKNDKRTIRILSRLTLFQDGKNLNGYRNIKLARDADTGKIAGLLILSDKNELGRLRIMQAGFYLITLVVLHSGFTGLTKFFLRAFINRKAAPDIPKDELYIGYLGVSKPYMKNGIGSRLLKQAEVMARKKNKKTLGLDVRKNNSEAIKLFEKSGFEEIRQIEDGAFGNNRRIYMSMSI